MEASALENAKESKMKMKRKLNPDVANRAVYRRKPPADVAAGVLAATTCLSASVCAHTTPADFAEMSLDQLFATTIGDETSGPQGGAGRWRFVYQFNQMEFQGYRDGTDDLSNDEVLWAGPGDTRTAANFPVLPANINQQVHIFRVSRTMSDVTEVSVAVPYIRQGTDHISIVPGYDTFLITPKGVGDIKLNVTRSLARDSLGGDLSLTAGLNLPTGSIDEVGDTPRAAGNQQLPYTMQLGSGTWDTSVKLTYANRDTNWHASISANISVNIKTGTNDRDYRLGNHYAANILYRFPLSAKTRLYAGLEGRHITRIHGGDESLTVPVAFRYPVSITNPDLDGVGQRTCWPASWGTYEWRLNAGVPMYSAVPDSASVFVTRCCN
jgi:hypothetical protein